MLNESKEFAIQNDLQQIESLTEQVCAFCAQIGVPESIFYDLRLAIEEAVSNTIRHGYTDQKPHTIHLTVKKKDENLFLLIEDDAKAFNPVAAPDPDLSLPIEEKKTGGLGIYLIKAIMDEVEYERVEGKNILRMRKALAG